jgi:hypothetical protein
MSILLRQSRKYDSSMKREYSSSINWFIEELEPNICSALSCNSVQEGD